MSRTKYLKGECQHCSGHLEFLAEHIGMTVPCPHCQQETELVLPAPPEEEPTVPRRALIWTGIAILVMGLGLGGAILALKRAQKWAETQKQQAAVSPAVDTPTNALPSVQETGQAGENDLVASNVNIQKTPGSSLVYAVGTLRNTSNRQRFGLRVELELSDATGQKIGSGSDYRQVLDPGGQWEFKALVVDSKAASARITSIQEDK